MSYVDTWRMGNIHYYVDILCTGKRASHTGKTVSHHPFFISSGKHPGDYYHHANVQSIVLLFAKMCNGLLGKDEHS